MAMLFYLSFLYPSRTISENIKRQFQKWYWKNCTSHDETFKHFFEKAIFEIMIKNSKIHDESISKITRQQFQKSRWAVSEFARKQFLKNHNESFKNHDTVQENTIFIHFHKSWTEFPNWKIKMKNSDIKVQKVRSELYRTTSVTLFSDVYSSYRYQ